MLRGLLLGAALAAATPAPASREAAARFDLSIAGIPIGDASLAVDRAGDAYAVRGAADVGFLFWGGDGTALTEGRLKGAALAPMRYRLAYNGATRPGEVEIAFAEGRAAQWRVAPPIPPEYREGRLPLRPEHLAGAADPLSALLIPAPADVAHSALCARTLAVFSGYTRFDLALSGGERLTDGSVRCAVDYRPVAGHREGSRGVARLSRPGAVTLSLAPLGDGFWAPRRLGLATRFGDFVLARR